MLVAVLVLLLPWWAPGFVEVDTLAGWVYLALAAEGLWIAAGLAGMPSLGQGAFMSMGAFTTALLTARAGWPAEATVPVGTAVALAAGLVIGAAVVRLPRLYIAVSTWILTWLVVLVATEFPGISGGAQGYVVSSSLDPTGHYVLAVTLTILLVVAGMTLQRSSVGVRLRALRDDPAAAVRLGVPRERLLLGAFAASAAVGGLAGSLAVQLAGVSDPNEFGPFTAFKLLVAVLLGGAAFAGSGPVGILVVGGIALVVRAWSAAGGHASAQLEPLLAAILLLLVLGLGSDGLLPALSRSVERYRPGKGALSGLGRSVHPSPAPRGAERARPAQELRRAPRPRGPRLPRRARRVRRDRRRERLRQDDGPAGALRGDGGRGRRDPAQRPPSAGACAPRLGRRRHRLHAAGHGRVQKHDRAREHPRRRRAAPPLRRSVSDPGGDARIAAERQRRRARGVSRRSASSGSKRPSTSPPSGSTATSSGCSCSPRR